MNNIDIFRLTLGLLQFGVAWYALRLGRLLKATAMGWVLFGALAIMALVSFVLAVQPLEVGAQWGIRVDIVYALLLLAGLTRFYPGLMLFLREEELKRKALDKWESQVKEQWVELVKTNEKLRETLNRYEGEIAERKQAQEQLQKSVQELLAAAREKEEKEKTLPPAMAGVDTEVIAPPSEPASELVSEPVAAPISAPAPEPVQANGLNNGLNNGANGELNDEHPVTVPVANGDVPHSNGDEPPANGDKPLTNGDEPHTNGDKPLPVVAGFDTAIIAHEPAQPNGGPEKNGELEENGEHLLTPSRNNGEELRPIALPPARNARKTATRKSSRPGRSSRSSQSSRRKRALAR